MREALAFLTPFGGAASPTPRAMRWFPVVGILIGGVLGLVWWLADEWWLPLVAGAIVVVFDLGFTNLLHLDGLADSADGLLPPLGTPARRLEVMADPTTGAFGVGMVAAVLILRFAAFTQAAPVLNSDFPLTGNWDGLSQGWLAMPLTLAGIWGVSRTTMAAGALALPYMREGGLAAAFLPDRSIVDGGGAQVRNDSGPPWALVAGGATAGALAATGAGWRGLVAVVLCALGAAAVFALAHRRIGGFTGDVLGAAGMIGETVALLALSFRIT